MKVPPLFGSNGFVSMRLAAGLLLMLCAGSAAGADTTAPVIGAHGDATRTEATSAAGAVVIYEAATAIDDSGAAPLITYSKESGTVFPIGVTTVVITARDAAGNASSSTFKVTVSDTTAPVVAEHRNIAAEATKGTTGAFVNYVPGGASDAVTPKPVLTYSKPSGSFFAIGDTVVTITATDEAGNASTGTFLVSVFSTKRVPPVIAPHADMVKEATGAAGAIVSYVPATATSVDGPVVISYSPKSETLFPIGVTTVTILAGSGNKNYSSSTFLVTVIDSKPPVISPHLDVFAEATSAFGAMVSYDPAKVVDSVTAHPVITYSKASGSLFPIGQTTVTITATDGAGNKATLNFIVTVADTTAPEFEFPGNLSVGAASAAGTVVTFPTSAVDAIDKAPSLVATPPSGSTFPIGVTTVRVVASDAAGNAIRGRFTVTVRDDIAPVLTLSDPKPVRASAGSTLRFGGRATDDLAVSRVEVILNGGSPQVIKPDSVTADFAWSLAIVPETGKNTVLITAYDLFNNPSAPSMRVFDFVHVRPEFAGNYNGLLAATAASFTPIDHEGLLHITVLSSGAFTGKAMIGGTVIPFKGLFLNDGSARFGKESSARLALLKKAEPIAITLGQLTLALDPAPLAERLTGASTLGSTTVAILAHADRAIYTAKKNPGSRFKNVPASLLESSIPLILRADPAPNHGVTDFPTGNGSARVSVAPSGVARIVGKLADGAPFSSSNALSRENTLPVFASLYAKEGLLAGQLFLEAGQYNAGEFTWYKRATPSEAQYPMGWPKGISVAGSRQ